MTINYIETMKQALEECINEKPAHASVILQSLIAQMQAAEKQEPIYQWRDTRSNTGAWTDSPLRHYKEWKQYPYYEWRVLYTRPAPTQPDSEQAKDAARYRHMRNNAQFEFRNGPGLYWYLPRNMSGDKGEQLDAAIDAAMKVGAGRVCHCAPLEK